jgi:cyclopropane fatty-acyl-phospholipid synthase-like methyltransferase
MLKDHQDALGHEFLDYLKEKRGYEIIEREDGYLDISGGPRAYFTDYKDWSQHEKKAMKYVRDKVLDIGCGAGRHSLYLQKNGFKVTGIDLSPLAVKVCKLRGLKNVRNLSITQVTPRLGIFDTILMLGNNFGLMENKRRTKWLLKRFYKTTSDKGRIIAETRDIYQTDNRDHLDYQAFNRKRGRMSGQIKIRARYRKYKTPWFVYLMVSQDEMRKIIRNTGWKVGKCINGKEGIYIAILEKE